MSQHTSGLQLLSGRRLLSMSSTQTELLQDQTDASSTPVTTETEALSRMQSLYNTIHPYVNDGDFSQTDLSNSITVLESVINGVAALDAPGLNNDAGQLFVSLSADIIKASSLKVGIG